MADRFEAIVESLDRDTNISANHGRDWMVVDNSARYVVCRVHANGFYLNNQWNVNPGGKLMAEAIASLLNANPPNVY